MTTKGSSEDASTVPCAPEVYSAEEVATVARVPPHAVTRLIASGEVATVDGTHLAQSEAARAARWLSRNQHRPLRIPFGASQLDRTLDAPPTQSRATALTAALHAVVLIVAIVLAMATPATTGSLVDPNGPALTRLVFVSDPGPGGGGGGGGLRQPLPPPPAEREGTSRVSSPIPPREEPAVVEPVEETEPELIESKDMPRIVAPLMEARADQQDRLGLIDELSSRRASPTQGPGANGGVGDGAGRGVGEGQGAGFGPGTGAGTGGGPYRPGAGITPPAIRHEVQPGYTEEARRRRIEGEVVLEVIVLADGSVGDIRILRSLGYGLDEAAVGAMRDWRFVPARRQDVPVAVFVEVAMEFRLR
ncbi:MAG: energy transducer TonB [Acidobacteria bacterium]|nr:energy transducer TonB [Acidobacteriota bacterium]